LLKLAEQKVVRKVRFNGRFCCKATKYVSKKSYFALKSSKIVSFLGLCQQIPGPSAAGGSAPGPSAKISKCAPEKYCSLIPKLKKNLKLF